MSRPVRRERDAARAVLLALFGQFPDSRIISLASRPDRRRRIVADLERLGLTMEMLGLRFFDGLTFDDKGAFPGIGVRGCFNSHLALMRACADSGKTMLVLEDDVDFDAPRLARFLHVAAEIAAAPWDILYLGYITPGSHDADPPRLLRYEGGTIGGHFYAVRPRFADAIATFMEQCRERPAGDPVGGPMYRDAAFSTFRGRHPEWVTYLASPSLAGQFSSRSSLTPGKYDRWPVVRDLAALARAAKSRLAR